MATIKKTFVTRLDNVILTSDVLRASVSLVDVEDDKNAAAHLAIVIKDGKVIQPDLNIAVEAAVAESTNTIMASLAKIVDQVITLQPIFIRGGAPR
jgi:hypothetical protein